MSRERGRALRGREAAPTATQPSLPSLGKLSLNDRRVLHCKDDEASALLAELTVSDVGVLNVQDDTGTWYLTTGEFKYRQFYEYMKKENWRWNKYYPPPDNIQWPADSAPYAEWNDFKDWTHYPQAVGGVRSGIYASESGLPHYLMARELAGDDLPEWPIEGEKALPRNWAAAWLPVIEWAARYDEDEGTNYSGKFRNLLKYEQTDEWAPIFHDLQNGQTETWTTGAKKFNVTKGYYILESIKAKIGKGKKKERFAKSYGKPLEPAPGWLEFYRPLLPKESAVDNAGRTDRKVPDTDDWRKHYEVYYYGPSFEAWQNQVGKPGVHTFKKAKSIKETWFTFLGLVSTGTAAAPSAQARSKPKRADEEDDDEDLPAAGPFLPVPTPFRSRHWPF